MVKRGFIVILISLLTFSLAFTFSDDDKSSEDNGFAEELFRLNSEIEIAKRQRDYLEQVLKSINFQLQPIVSDIYSLNNKIKAYKQEFFRLLKIKQRQGAYSFWEQIFKSRSLSDFYRRLSILEHTAGAYRSVYEQIETETQNLQKRMDELTKLQIKESERFFQLEEKLSELVDAAEKLEKYLDSKAEKREEYEKKLAEIQEQWDALRPLFTKTIKGFIEIIESGGLPEDMVEVKFGFSGVKAYISDQDFNDAVKSEKDLPLIQFKFIKEEVQVDFPDFQMKLIGNFKVHEKQSLIFEVVSGEFRGMDMSRAAMDDLFMDQNLVFNLGGLLGKNEMNDVKSLDGRVEIGVKIKW